jgi:predicted GIY-YIG superfamily endonuclease
MAGPPKRNRYAKECHTKPTALWSNVLDYKSAKCDEKMFYVYLIRSIKFPNQKYIGMTEDLKNRLKQHNSGESYHTSKFKPWKLINYIAFSSKNAAIDFEKYLKTGSGQSFSNRHLWK